MDLNALREFAAIAQEGSFAGAARRLGTPKSTVSKRIQDLEAALGTRLIERTTRKLRLTAEGTLVLARAERILADAGEIAGALGAGPVTGHLRLAVPVLFGQTFMGQIAAASRRLHPRLSMEVVLSDGQPDLVEEGFDAAIRLGENSVGAYAAETFATTRRVVVAAPDLVAAPCDHPRGLADLPALLFGHGLVQSWSFTDGRRIVSVRLAGGLAMTSQAALRDAALGGAGVAQLPLYLVEADLAAGRLRPALSGWDCPEMAASLVYPGAHALTARLRAVLGLLKEAFPAGTLHGGLLRGPA